MTPVVFPLPGNEAFAKSLTAELGAALGASEFRRFPDGESYIRIATPVVDRSVILVCTLDRPDERFLPLSFMAATARDLGAAQVGLVCPYLAYMRQDKRFHPGEAISSTYFAKLLDATSDWLVTVDPHLHRRHSLGEIFSRPATAVHAAPYLASWIRENIANPILVGPDGESEQWVTSVAADAGAPYVVLEKVRSGDRDVAVSAPPSRDLTGRTPVIVDDIISTGRTMIETIRRLADAGARPPVCVGVHAIFAGDSYADLHAAGAETIVTCNTISHHSNAIDLANPVAGAVRELILGLNSR